MRWLRPNSREPISRSIGCTRHFCQADPEASEKLRVGNFNRIFDNAKKKVRALGSRRTRRSPEPPRYRSRLHRGQATQGTQSRPREKVDGFNQIQNKKGKRKTYEIHKTIEVTGGFFAAAGLLIAQHSTVSTFAQRNPQCHRRKLWKSWRKRLTQNSKTTRTAKTLITFRPWAKVPSELFGITIVTVDGKVINVGDVDHRVLDAIVLKGLHHVRGHAGVGRQGDLREDQR